MKKLTLFFTMLLCTVTLVAQTTCEPLHFTQTFTDSSLGDFTVQDVSGGRNWHNSGQYGVVINTWYSSNAAAEDDYLISPAFDLSGVEDINISFDHLLYKATDLSLANTYCELLVTNAYTDDATTTKWEKITIPEYSGPSAWTTVNITEVPLRTDNVRFAFHITNNVDNQDFQYYWEIRNLSITTTCHEYNYTPYNLNAEIDNIMVTLLWEVEDVAPYYYVEVYEGTDYENLYINGYVASFGADLTFSTDDAGKTFVWRVNAVNEEGEQLGEVMESSFTLPDELIDYAPSNLQVSIDYDAEQICFTWTASAHTTRHGIYVSKEDAESPLIFYALDETYRDGICFSLGAFEDGTYVWDVVGIDDNNHYLSSWVVGDSFTIEKPEEKEAITVRLDINDFDEIGGVGIYAWVTDANESVVSEPCGKWPGTKLYADNDGWFTYTFDADIVALGALHIIWNNHDGENAKNQTYNIDNVTENTCYRITDFENSVTYISYAVVDCPTEPEPVYYNVTVTAGVGGVVDDVNGTYLEGTELILRAEANDGYEFYMWSDQETENPREIVVTQDIDLTAYFNPLPVYYTLTITAGVGGTVNTTGGKYEEGAEVEIEAFPNQWYEFVQWSDGIADNPRMVIINSDITLEAQFNHLPEEYEITFETDGNGVVDYPSGIYVQGTALEVTAWPNSGYKFSHWEDGTSDNPRIIVINGEATYTAHFMENNGELYNVVLGATEGGTVSPDGDIIAEDGAIIEIQAINEEGYKFWSWSDGDSQASRHLTVLGNEDIFAIFLPAHTVWISTTDGGTVNGVDWLEITLADVECEELLASPAEGYKFIGWSDDVQDNPRTIKLTESYQLVAMFDIDSSIDAIRAFEAKVYGTNESIVAQSSVAQDLYIYSATGKLISAASAITEHTAAVPNGLYLVRLGNVTYKVIVK